LKSKIFLLVTTTQTSRWKQQQIAQILHPRPSSVLCSKWCRLLYGMQSCTFAGFTGL